MNTKDLQKELEDTHNKNLLMDRVFSEFKSDEALQKLINDAGLEPHIANKALVFIAIYKRVGLDTFISMLYKPTGIYPLEEIVSEVEKLVKLKFILFDCDKLQFIVRFQLDEETQKELDAFQYPLPLVVKPKLIRNNFSSAYYQKRKQSILLKNKSTKKDVNLEHINLMNQVAFQINTNVLAKAENHWDPKKNPDETERNFKRFTKYCKVAQKIIMDCGNKFYFSHRYDYRGRTYDEGYYIHYQGNDYCKSLIEFANKEIIE